MDDIFRITLLLDFYGQLIPDRQLEIMNLHYNEDFTLAEIAEQFNISRQGVFDYIKKARTELEIFEDKLGLIKKYEESKFKLEDAVNALKAVNIQNMTPDDSDRLLLAVKIVTDIIKDL